MDSLLAHTPTTMLLRKLESSAPLNREEHQAIGRLPVRIHRLDARQDIVREGDRTGHCCLILDGWACRYKLLREGKRQILSFHVAGDVPDLQSLHVPTMDSSLATLTAAVVAFVPHEDLRDLMDRHPGITALFWRDTLIEAAILREWVMNIGRRLALERVAHLFCELHLKLQAVGLATRVQCPLPITQTDLADALGLTPVHINRVLQTMRAQSLIGLRSRTLVMESWDELLRIAEFDPTYMHLPTRAAA